MPYKGARKSLPVIAKECGRRDCRGYSSAVRPESPNHSSVDLCSGRQTLVSGRYERELRDILQLQAEIAKDIAVRFISW